MLFSLFSPDFPSNVSSVTNNQLNNQFKGILTSSRVTTHLDKEECLLRTASNLFNYQNEINSGYECCQALTCILCDLVKKAETQKIHKRRLDGWNSTALKHLE